MAQEFYPTFDPDDQVQTTMSEIFSNVRTLRSKFSGNSTPGSPQAFQWWASTSDDILYLRNSTNTAWLPIYNFNTEELLLDDGQVTSSIISNGARKGTIVQGEDISPNSCAIRATALGAGQTLVSRSDQSSYSSLSSTGSWQTLLESRVYIPSDSAVLRMICELQRAKARFYIGGLTSSETNTTGGGLAWTSTEAVGDTSALSAGWKTFLIEGYTTSSFSAGLRGVAMRWA